MVNIIRQFLHRDTYTIDFLVNANNCNNKWKNTTKQQITKRIVCSEKRTKNHKENVKMSNN